MIISQQFSFHSAIQEISERRELIIRNYTLKIGLLDHARFAHALMKDTQAVIFYVLGCKITNETTLHHTGLTAC